MIVLKLLNLAKYRRSVGSGTTAKERKNIDRYSQLCASLSSSSLSENASELPVTKRMPGLLLTELPGAGMKSRVWVMKYDEDFGRRG